MTKLRKDPTTESSNTAVHELEKETHLELWIIIVQLLLVFYLIAQIGNALNNGGDIGLVILSNSFFLILLWALRHTVKTFREGLLSLHNES